MTLKAYQREFIEFTLSNKVLYFGQFTLKSGRLSPYFFNAGRFSSGGSLKVLGQYYAKAILDKEDLEFDALFGPAYKGIPLVSATSIALASFAPEDGGRDVPYAFNRKEEKDHGEGGKIVGADIAGSAS